MEMFLRYFITYGGYKRALLGLRNTLIIAISGLIIGIVIGSIVAAVKVAATRSKVAKAFSYVGDIYTTVFRGTPMVVQLLLSAQTPASAVLEQCTTQIVKTLNSSLSTCDTYYNDLVE